jgi:hypothetical protein
MGGGGGGQVVPSLRAARMASSLQAVRTASASGRRGGGPGSGRAWWHTGARALGGGSGLLEEGEGEGAGVGWAGREAEAQLEWGGAGRPKAKAQAARLKPELGPIQEIKPFQILFGIQIFGKSLEICTRRFRRDFDMRIFPKIF